MKVVVSILISLAFHVFIGWEWSAVGGILAGFWTIRRGWLNGMLAVGASWSLLVVYNIVVAQASTVEYFRIGGELLGGLPEAVIPVATIVVACIIGALSGLLGTAIAGLRKEPVVVEIE